jgi:hypothetical protein
MSPCRYSYCNMASHSDSTSDLHSARCVQFITPHSCRAAGGAVPHIVQFRMMCLMPYEFASTWQRCTCTESDVGAVLPLRGRLGTPTSLGTTSYHSDTIASPSTPCESGLGCRRTTEPSRQIASMVLRNDVTETRAEAVCRPSHPSPVAHLVSLRCAFGSRFRRVVATHARETPSNFPARAAAHTGNSR